MAAARRLTKSGRDCMMLKKPPIFTCCISFIIAAYVFIPLTYVMTIPHSSQPHNHQVFINFRGDELRYNFISHLTNAFKNEGITFFIDNDMKPGKDLKNLFVKIEESSIALTIFSPRYTQSRWCMNELLHINRRSNEGKLYVIPVFYKVQPSHVRKPKRESEFGQNFWRFVEVSSDCGDPIQEWREAFACTSNKLGLTLGKKSSEADFIKEIVQAVKRVNKEIGLEKEKKRIPIRPLQFFG